MRLIVAVIVSVFCSVFAQANIDVYTDQVLGEISPLLMGSGDEISEEFVPPEVQTFIGETGVPLLRMGGIANEYYDWEGNDYNGQQYYDFFGSTIIIHNTETSMNDFLFMCEELSIEPVLSVNFQINDPGKAARLVEYCNGDQTTPMGSIRAAQGHPEPYNVVYWEIGNEPDISGIGLPLPGGYIWTLYRHFNLPFEQWDWQDSIYASPGEYADLVGIYIDSMRARSPIPIEIAGISLANDIEWLQITLEQNAEEIDWVDIHYYPCVYIEPVPPDTSDYIEWLAAPDTGVMALENYYAAMVEIVDSASGGLDIPVCIMEYNSLVLSGDAVWWNYLDGLFIADCIGHLASAGCPMAGVYSIYEGDFTENDLPLFGMIRGDTLSARSTAWVMRLYNDHFEGTLIETTCDASGGGYGLEAYTSIRSDGRLCIIAVNKLLDETVQATINLHDYISAGIAEIWDITNDAPMNAPWNGTTGVQYQGILNGTSTSFEYLFPKASVTCFEILPDTTGISPQTPEAFDIECYPNPSTGAVTICIDIRELERITMNVFDVSGRLQTTIIETILPAGKHSIIWNRTDEDGGILPAGKYMLLVHINDQPVDCVELLLR
jgi:alpha-L-arabinofuranosidase